MFGRGFYNGLDKEIDKATTVCKRGVLGTAIIVFVVGLAIGYILK